MKSRKRQECFILLFHLNIMQYNMASRRNRKHQDWNEKDKLFFFFSDDIIIYIENSIEFRKRAIGTNKSV